MGTLPYGHFYLSRYPQLGGLNAPFSLRIEPLAFGAKEQREIYVVIVG